MNALVRFALQECGKITRRLKESMTTRPLGVGQWVSVNKQEHIGHCVSRSVCGATLLSISWTAGASAPSLRLIILSWTSSFHARPASTTAYLSIHLHSCIHRHRIPGCFRARATTEKITWILSSAGASLNESPPPNYNNWPQFSGDLSSSHLTEQQPSCICTRPENFYHT